MLKRSLCSIVVGFLLMVPVRVRADEKPFHPFATVTVGTYVSSDDYVRDIKRNGMSIGAGRAYNTDLAIRAVPISQTPHDLELVMITPADLGFVRAPRREAFYARAVERGLWLCPAEAALALRLAYRSQPRNERAWIAMKPVETGYHHETDSTTPHILELDAANDGSLWLVSDSVFSDDFIDTDRNFVFLLDESQSLAKRRSPDKLEFRPTKAITFGAFGMGVHTTFGSGGNDAYLSWLGAGAHLFRSRDNRLLAGGIGLQLMGTATNNTSAATFGLGLQVMPVSVPIRGRWLYATPTYTRILTGHPRQRNAVGVNFTMVGDFSW